MPPKTELKIYRNSSLFDFSSCLASISFLSDFEFFRLFADLVRRRLLHILFDILQEELIDLLIVTFGQTFGFNRGHFINVFRNLWR